VNFVIYVAFSVLLSTEIKKYRQSQQYLYVFIVAPCTSQSHLIGTPTNAHT